MARPLVLVPSSKAKSDAGGGPAYGQVVAADTSPLGDARRAVLDALTQAAGSADDRQIARLCAATDHHAVTTARAQLHTLAQAPTIPAHRRYTGVVHRFAQLGEVVPADAGVDIATFTGLTGIAMLDDPVPDYRLEVMGRVPELGVLRTWWRRRLGPVLRAQAAGRTVWDLLPGEFTTMWPPAEREGVTTITVGFRRADGRAAPSASAKVAKGQLVQALVANPELTVDELAGADLLDGWRWVRHETGVDAYQRT